MGVIHAAVVVGDLLDGEVSSPYVLNGDNGSFQVSLRGGQNADRSSHWMGFSIDACLTADAWTCEEPFKMNFSFNNGSAPFKIGDCLIPFNQTWVKDLQQNTQFSMMLPRGSGMLKTMGTWLPDLTCGCGIQVNYTCAGLRLHDTTTITPKQPSSSLVPIKCPKGKIAVKKANAEPSNRCTQKYGDASHGWEQNGLLCYPDCSSGYYGVGPVCWKSRPSDMHDGGVFCSKHKYVPHTRAVWPWSHCHHDERHYGFEVLIGVDVQSQTEEADSFFVLHPWLVDVLAQFIRRRRDHPWIYSARAGVRHVQYHDRAKLVVLHLLLLGLWI